VGIYRVKLVDGISEEGKGNPVTYERYFKRGVFQHSFEYQYST
jgi:hypothetical protein